MKTRFDVKSIIHDGVHSYGKFVCSYKTLELAKDAALYWNECIGWRNENKTTSSAPLSINNRL